MAVLAPLPSASVRITMPAKAGFFQKTRSASFRSWPSPLMLEAPPCRGRAARRGGRNGESRARSPAWRLPARSTTYGESPRPGGVRMRTAASRDRDTVGAAGSGLPPERAMPAWPVISRVLARPVDGRRAASVPRCASFRPDPGRGGEYERSNESHDKTEVHSDLGDGRHGAPRRGPTRVRPEPRSHQEPAEVRGAAAAPGRRPRPGHAGQVPLRPDRRPGRLLQDRHGPVPSELPPRPAEREAVGLRGRHERAPEVELPGRVDRRHEGNAGPGELRQPASGRFTRCPSTTRSPAPRRARTSTGRSPTCTAGSSSGRATAAPFTGRRRWGSTVRPGSGGCRTASES